MADIMMCLTAHTQSQRGLDSRSFASWGPSREQGLNSLLMKATHSLGPGPCTHICRDTTGYETEQLSGPLEGQILLLGIKSLAKCLLFKFPGPSIVIFIPLRLKNIRAGFDQCF